MDIVTIAISSALRKPTNSTAKAFEELKGTIERKLGADNELSKAILNLEKQPDSPSRKNLLKKEAVQVRGNTEVVDAARRILKTLQSN